MPAMRRSNCMVLCAGHPPFVSASKRPIAALRCVEEQTFAAAGLPVVTATHTG